MAKHHYARAKDEKPKDKQARADRRQAKLQLLAHRTVNRPKPSAYAYRGCDITRNGGGPDNQRWMASKPSTKEGFAPVHIGDFATIGAAARAIDGFKAAIRG